MSVTGFRCTTLLLRKDAGYLIFVFFMRQGEFAVVQANLNEVNPDE